MMDNQKDIGGRTFSFGYIPAEEAVEVHVAVARVIGEPLFKAFMDSKSKGDAKSGENAKDDVEQAGAVAIGLMVSKMNAAELKETMRTVFKYTTCDGNRIEMNATFTGRSMEMYKVFLAGLRYNFSDFLPEGLFASIREKIQK